MQLSPLLDLEIHPSIADLAQYCGELSGETELPRRAHFRPSRVAQIISYLFLIDVLRDDDDYRFSLFGSNMAILYGQDLTRKRLSEVGDAELRAELRKTYDQVVETGQPLYVRGRYVWPNVTSIKIERLLVPMTDECGRVTTILGVAIPDISPGALLIFAGHGPARLQIDEVLSLQ